jgi:aldehyde dehydrogenase (NAD+)
LLERIEARFAALRPGATWDTEATLPPIISAGQAARILEIVERARDAGATLRCGGGCSTAARAAPTSSRR